MSVENHRHCQATILSASGTSTGGGATWNTISGLNLANLMPTNWKNKFLSNTSNITQDFKSTLEIINDTAASLNSSITNLTNTVNIYGGKIQNIEGSMGKLYNQNIACYIAPNQAYFDALVEKRILEKHTDDGTYYTVKSGHDPIDYMSYCYLVSGQQRIYPGSDSNLENQYKNNGREEQKKYPLFTLNKAMTYLARYRSSGSITYHVKTQFGDYDYEETWQSVRLVDAQAGSTLLISPEMTVEQQKRLAGYIGGESYFTGSGYQDSGLVRTRFVWNDREKIDGEYKTEDQYWTAWVGYIGFYDSTTVCRQVGFILKRQRPAASYNKTHMTYNVIQVKSGTVYFYQCVFRNAYLHHNTASEPPTISFHWMTVDPKYLKTATYRLPYLKDDWKDKPDVERTYNQNNIAKWTMPTIFVDDPAPNGVNANRATIPTPFIRLGAGENATLMLQMAYVIFRNKRNYDTNNNAINLIDVGSGDALRIQIGYNLPSRLVFVNDGCSFERAPISFTSMTQGVCNQSGWDQTVHELARTQDQFQIHFVDSTTSAIPSWLKYQMSILSTWTSHKYPEGNITPPTKITSNKDYDGNTGNYNIITRYLWAPGDGMVYFNGNSIPSGK